MRISDWSSDVCSSDLEELGRIGQVDLVDVVVDGPAGLAGEIGDRVAVVGEAGLPAVAVDALQVLHPVDLVAARGVARTQDRPPENPLGALLRLLVAQESTEERSAG